MSTVRAQKSQGISDRITGREGLSTDFALILSVSAIVVVDEMMRSTTQRAYSVYWNTFSIAALYWFQMLVIFPEIVFKEELPVLFDKSFDHRKFIHFEFLIFGRKGNIESPLFKRNVFADKIKKPADLLMLVLNKGK